MYYLIICQNNLELQIQNGPITVILRSEYTYMQISIALHIVI